MDPLKDTERTRLAFGKPIPIPKNTRQAFTNTFGNIRAIVENGTVSIQVKKHKGSNREVVYIDLNSNPPTIELAMEE